MRSLRHHTYLVSNSNFGYMKERDYLASRDVGLWRIGDALILSML